MWIAYAFFEGDDEIAIAVGPMKNSAVRALQIEYPEVPLDMIETKQMNRSSLPFSYYAHTWDGARK